MFKLNRHKSDRMGDRFEFKFSSFQALQVPKGWDKLYLSIVSLGTGKTIAKSSKTTVRSGNCQWMETVTEYITIPQDDTPKEPAECLFKIIVSMGSHRSGILGEVVLNLTDYMSSWDSGPLSLPLKKCNYGTILQVRIQCLNPKTRFRDRRTSKERTPNLEGLHNNNDDIDSKSDGSDNVFNRSVGSSSNNNLAATYPDEPVNRDTSFSATGSHRSSDSGDSSIGRMNFSPKNISTGGSYMGRQDSAESHNSATYSVGLGDDLSRSNPSSFNSRASGSSTPNRWQESTVQASAHGLASVSLRPSDSSKDFLEAEETIEELRDEAKMWERHAHKLKLDVEKLKKECLAKSKHQAEMDIELSAAYSERDSLKQEVGQLKLSLEETMTNQTSTGTAKIDGMLCTQKELERELKAYKESNATLSLQLKKTQEANIEFVSILEELEETVEKQRLEIANLSQHSPVCFSQHSPGSGSQHSPQSVSQHSPGSVSQHSPGSVLQHSPGSEYEGDMRSPTLLDIEAEWTRKLSAKEDEISKLEKKITDMLDAQNMSEMVHGQGHSDLIKEIEVLTAKVQELEKDCAELTDENLELLYKMKESGKGIKEGKDSDNPESEIWLLKSQICQLEEELRRKEMLNDGLIEPSSIQMTNLKKKCANLELELQYFKDQAFDLDVKLRESQAEVDGKIVELTELQEKLKFFEVTDRIDFDTTERRDVSYTEVRQDSSGGKAGKKSEIEELKAALLLKDKEIDILRQAREELENLVSNIQREKSQLEENLTSVLRESNITSRSLEDVQRDLMLLTNSVDSHVSANKILERKLGELESGKCELEIHISDLEEENVQLSKRISGLEAQLRQLTNEKDSSRLNLEDSRSLIAELKDEIVRQEAEAETQKGELKQKLQETHNRLSEAQEETENLKRSHSKLQSTLECLIEERKSLQKSTGDLRRQKLELYEHSSHLEVDLSESQERNYDFVKKIESLELKVSLLQSDIALKEESLNSQLENMLHDHKDQEEKISQAKLMLNQIDVEKTIELENLKREFTHLSSQVCSSQDEREKMASDAVREVSILRIDNIKLESSVQESQNKVKLYETELQTLRRESGKKVQGLTDSLNASKQSEEMLMSDIERMQRQVETAKSNEERFKRGATELELKLKASDYEKQQIMEEVSDLKVQLQKIAHLQNEILGLKSSLDEAKFEKGKLEELLQLVSEECEELKTERASFTEKISIMQKALHDGEDDRSNRIALEEKLLRLESDLTVKEALYAQEAELKNEINRFKRINSEHQRKIKSIEEEKDGLLQKSQELEEELALSKRATEILDTVHHEKEMQTQDVSECMQHFNSDKTKKMDDNKLHNLEQNIEVLEAKIHSLETELAEAVEANNMYKIQLTGLLTEKRSSQNEILKKCSSENDMNYHQAQHQSQACKIASLETELKEMKDRYLNMSLQYAEVEAQREELVMKLRSLTKGKRWFS